MQVPVTYLTRFGKNLLAGAEGTMQIRKHPANCNADANENANTMQTKNNKSTPLPHTTTPPLPNSSPTNGNVNDACK